MGELRSADLLSTVFEAAYTPATNPGRVPRVVAASPVVAAVISGIAAAPIPPFRPFWRQPKGAPAPGWIDAKAEPPPSRLPSALLQESR